MDLGEGMRSTVSQVAVDLSLQATQCISTILLLISLALVYDLRKNIKELAVLKLID